MIRFLKKQKHEKWNPDFGVENDIALITLENEVQFNEEIQPACLPSPASPSLSSSSSTNLFPDIDSKGYIAGWGLTKDEDYDSAPYVLQNVQVVVYDPILCFLESAELQICLGLYI